MERNFRDIETIIELKGFYEWNGDGKILIQKTEKGYEVGGFEFTSVKAACHFIESYPTVSILLTKGLKLGVRIAKSSTKEGARMIGFGLRWVGSTLQTVGVSIQKKGGL